MRRKHRGELQSMAGKGGGAWKVAYADFVTAMMAFFMVMWITAQNEEVKEAVAQHFQDPYSAFHGEEGDEKSHQHGSDRTNQRGKHSDQPLKPGRPRPLRVEVGKGNETATGTTIFFADESAELDQPAKDQLAKLMPVILGKPQKIEIRGHSSRMPLPAGSPYRSFWELSYARCLSTMNYLEEQGIAPERMRLSQAGVYEPESTSGGEAPRQARVDVHLLDEVAIRLSTGDAKPTDAVEKDPERAGVEEKPVHEGAVGDTHAAASIKERHVSTTPASGAHAAGHSDGAH
jgi:chemotaxis protein MotB